MKNILHKKTKISLLLLLLFFIFLPSANVNAQAAKCLDMDPGDECTSGNYRITYTGIDEFGNRKFIVKEINVGTDDRYIESPFLTDYLAAAYRYSVIVTTVLATVVIIFAGVLWITSGGNVEKIGRAKKLIGRSITGLVLAVGSYTILWTINPQLVEFGSLKILRVEQISLEEALGGINIYGSGDAPAEAATVLRASGGKWNYDFNNVPYFAQGDSRWGKEPYKNKQGTTCGTIAQGGCGPTSIAMVLKSFNKPGVSPLALANLATQSGAVICGNGTSMKSDFREAIENNYDVVVEKITSESKALELLRAGNPLIQGGRHKGYTNEDKIKNWGAIGGHYIVFTGVDTLDNGTEVVRVNDSGWGNPNGGIVYKTMDLFRETGREFWYIHPR